MLGRDHPWTPVLLNEDESQYRAMRPPPADIVAKLLQQGLVTAEQAALARREAADLHRALELSERAERRDLEEKLYLAEQREAALAACSRDELEVVVATVAR